MSEVVIHEVGTDTWGSRVVYDKGFYVVEDWGMSGPFEFVDSFTSREDAILCCESYITDRP